MRKIAVAEWTDSSAITKQNVLGLLDYATKAGISDVCLMQSDHESVSSSDTLRDLIATITPFSTLRIHILLNHPFSSTLCAYDYMGFNAISEPINVYPNQIILKLGKSDLILYHGTEFYTTDFDYACACIQEDIEDNYVVARDGHQEYLFHKDLYDITHFDRFAGFPFSASVYVIDEEGTFSRNICVFSPDGSAEEYPSLLFLRGITAGRSYDMTSVFGYSNEELITALQQIDAKLLALLELLESESPKAHEISILFLKQNIQAYEIAKNTILAELDS